MGLKEYTNIGHVKIHMGVEIFYLMLALHQVRGILVDAIPHSEYTKIVDKSTVKSIFESLYSTNEGNSWLKKIKLTNWFISMSFINVLKASNSMLFLIM
jgi:hypothetical protein